MIRARGAMTDAQYNDRRCNGCGHRWTIGGTLDLPLGEPKSTIKPTKGESGNKPQDYDFGDGFEPEQDGIPF